MFRYFPRIQRAIAEDLDPHFLLLDLNQRVNLPKDGLQRLVTTLVVMQELLDISQRVAQLRLMNQGQLVVVGKDDSYLLFNDSRGQLKSLICILDSPLELLRKVAYRQRGQGMTAGAFSTQLKRR